MKKNCRVTPKGKEADIWANYRLVKDRTTHAFLDAAQCSRCKRVFAYKEGVGGTGYSTMNRHLSKCKERLPAVDPFLDKLDPPIEAKTDFAVAGAKFCAFKSLSPAALTGPGAEQFVQACIDKGVSNGRVDAGQVLCHPQTIAEYIDKEANKARVVVKDEVTSYTCPRATALRCNHRRMDR